MLLPGCANNIDDEPERIGRLFVSIEIDPALSLPDGSPAGVEANHTLENDDVSFTMTALAGDYTHTWTSFADFTQGEDYFAGTYLLTGDAGRNAEQGFDTPRFTGETTVEIADGTGGIAYLKLTPESAFFSVSYTESFLSAYPDACLSLQAGGSGIFPIEGSERRLLCLDVAAIEGYISLPGLASFRAFSMQDPRPATLYSLKVDLINRDGYPVISVGYPGGNVCETVLTPEFLNSSAPEAAFDGLESISIELPEGENTPQPVLCTVRPAGAALSKVMLTISSASLVRQGAPVLTDLLKPASPEAETLRRLGLKTQLNPAEGGTIDFNDLLGSLIYLTPDDAVSTFTVVAEDAAGRISTQAILTVTTSPISLSVSDVSTAVMGLDKAEITIVCPATDFEERVSLLTASADSVWRPLPIREVVSEATGRYKLTVDVGEGSEPVPIRVVYCDEIRASFAIKRIMPDFSLIVDAYAAYANILVVPADAELIGKILPRVKIYLDNKPYNLFMTEPGRGLLTIIGLKPSTGYTVKATMMDPSTTTKLSFCREVEFSTEGTPQLPNADFEERRDGPAYTYLPSGGLYSQTTVEIFNRQHSITYDMRVPKNWVNVNDKTFNNKSANHNTWYMQPSTYSLTSPVQNGTFACELASVGFDPTGEPIPPYVQTSTPFLDYSPVIPEIKYKAAGKLFLGSYSFNPSTMTETYTEGISWGARPMSLNGYYIFSPCDNDRSDAGLVRVEVLGSIDGEGETVIASGEVELPLCTGWKAFTLPLTYSQFGVKARKLKVMFASSRHVGTIEEESAGIILDYDPVKATASGGRLSLDNVYLSY